MRRHRVEEEIRKRRRELSKTRTLNVLLGPKFSPVAEGSDNKGVAPGLVDLPEKSRLG